MEGSRGDEQNVRKDATPTETGSYRRRVDERGNGMKPVAAVRSNGCIVGGMHVCLYVISRLLFVCGSR